MQVFIRRIQTKEYLTESKEWIKDISRAHNFKKSVLALTYCGDHRVSGAEILLSFGDARYDVVLPAFGGRDWPESRPTPRPPA